MPPGNVILSCQVGEAKVFKNAKMFRSAVGLLKKRPYDCILVDDSYNVIRKADEFGLQTIEVPRDEEKIADHVRAMLGEMGIRC